MKQTLLLKLSNFSANERFGQVNKSAMYQIQNKEPVWHFFLEHFLLKCHSINVNLIYIQMTFDVLLQHFIKREGGRNIWMGTLTFQILN